MPVRHGKGQRGFTLGIHAEADKKSVRGPEAANGFFLEVTRREQPGNS